MFGADHELVEYGEGVTHRAAAGAHGEFEDAGLGFDLLLVADVFKVWPHDLRRDQAERVVVGA